MRKTVSCTSEDEGSRMMAMRVRGKVVGNVVVLEESMPEGTEVEVVTADEGGVYVDEATEEELAQAMKEADTEEGVSVEEAFARLPPRKRIA
jgi:hypothetical protein